MLRLTITLLMMVAMPWLSWHNAAWLPFTLPGSQAAENITGSELRLPEYKPRKADSPRARIGGKSRGLEADTPLLIALVPDHVAFTVKNDPALCWYLSLDTSRPITITVVDSRGIRPILEQSLPSPISAGIHCMRPRAYGVEFKAQESYRWFVTVVVDQSRPSRDVVAGGMIERISFDEACALGMPCTWPSCDTEGIYRYAESGLWYDAIGCLLDLIEQEPDKDRLQRMLGHLLRQSGVILPNGSHP